MQLFWMVCMVSAFLLNIPAKVMSFEIGDQQTVKYSRHNLMALSRINVNGGENGGSMEGVTYNNYGEICVYCHTPHNANPNYAAPLWNRANDTSTFQLYSSLTLDATPNQPGGVSLACLSCHDGTIAVDSLYNKPQVLANNHRGMSTGGGSTSCAGFCHGSGGAVRDHRSRYLGTDLTNDHPISIDYSEAYSAQTVSEFADSGSIVPLKLFKGKVECATCHDVHTPTNRFLVSYGAEQTYRSFHLRKNNDSSGLCLTCHLK